jgi:hypothetical protein
MMTTVTVKGNVTGVAPSGGMTMSRNWPMVPKVYPNRNPPRKRSKKSASGRMFVLGEDVLKYDNVDRILKRR